MIGADRHTGKPLKGDAHLAQSVADILTTPIGSRVMRRDYGSRLPELIDAPLNGETQIEIFAATAEALLRWEPRIELRRVRIDDASPAGSTRLLIEYAAEGREVATGVVIFGGAI